MNPFQSYRWSDVPKMAGLAILYALLIKAVLGYLTTQNFVSIVWLPSGLGLAALLIGGTKYWPGIFIGAMGSYVMLLDRSLSLSFFIALFSNTLEPLIGAWWLSRSGMKRQPFDAALNDSNDYIRLGEAAVFSTAIAALTGSISLLQAGILPQETYLVALVQWWMGNLLGMVLLVPLILIWWNVRRAGWAPRRLIEIITCFGLTILCGQAVFLKWFGDSFGQFTQSYWMFLFVVWGAVRFGRHSVTLIICVTALQALLGALHGVGPFSNGMGQPLLLDFWFFMIIYSVVGTALVLVINERKKTEMSLEVSHRKFGRQTELLRSMLEAIGQGFAVWDAEDRLVIWNKQCFDYWYTPPNIRTGMARNELLLHIAANNGFGQGDPQLLANRRIQSILSGEQEDVFTMHDGRVVHVIRYAMPDGGHASVYSDITERRRSEQALRESESQFRSAVEFSAIGVAIVGLDGHWIKVNASLSKILGYEQEELLHMNFQQVTHPDDLGTDLLLAQELLNNYRQSYQIEKRYFHKQGHVVYAQLNVSLVRGTEGIPRHFISQIQDITERKQLQMQQVLAVLEASPDMMLLVGENRVIKYANSVAQQLLGYQSSDLVGLGIETVVPLRSRSSQRDTNWSYAAQSRSTSTVEQLFALRQDGSEFPVEISRSPLLMDNKSMLILAVVDISERVLREANFKELLSFNQTIVAKSDTGIMVHRLTGECVLANEAAEEIVGATSEQLSQHNFRLSWSWQESGQLKVADEVLQTGATLRFSAPMRTIYGKDIWCSSSLSRIVRNGELHLLTVFSDISPHKAAEVSMRQARDAAESALKRAMQAERRIIDISEETLQRIGRELHDNLGQHLTGVAFLAETLFQDLKNRDRTEMQDASRVTGLINEAVSQVRQLAQGLYPVELKEAGLKAMLRHLARNIQSIYNVECMFISDEHWQLNDPDIAINLFRIAQEAIGNAVRHGRATQIELALRKTQDSMVLEIVDNGGGIKETNDKSGLGMHTMQYRASMIGGTIQVMPAKEGDEDAPRGTRVVVSFSIQ